MDKGISGLTALRKAADKYSTVMPTLNTAAPTMTPCGVGPVIRHLCLPYPRPASLARMMAWERSATCILVKMFET